MIRRNYALMVPWVVGTPYCLGYKAFVLGVPCHLDDVLKILDYTTILCSHNKTRKVMVSSPSYNFPSLQLYGPPLQLIASTATCCSEPRVTVSPVLIGYPPPPRSPVHQSPPPSRQPSLPTLPCKSVKSMILNS